MAKSPTVRIKLTQSMGGNYLDAKGLPRGQFVKNPGDVVELPADEAARYIERGYATSIDDKAA